MRNSPTGAAPRNDNGGDRARLDFCDTKIGRANAPTSHSSIAPGATVHQCATRDFIPSIPKPLIPSIAYETQDT